MPDEPGIDADQPAVNAVKGSMVTPDPAQPAVAQPIKVLLHDNGEDVETLWAVPVGGPPHRLLVRLDNVPFLHAKPTYGDVIEVRSADEQPGWLSWNAAGRTYTEICDALVEDGGRYAVIVDYTCDDMTVFGTLTAWAKREADLECEGNEGPTPQRPGRLYIAARYAVGTDAILQFLSGNSLGFRFELVHPR